MTPAEIHFSKTAPYWMGRLLADFRELDKFDAAAVFGNAGHESVGLTVDQEIGIKAPKGGLNWFQWTGPRRRDFEAYCKRSGKDEKSDEAAYAFLFLELKGSEKHAIRALRAAQGLDAKTVAFEKSFERAGVKHHDRRKKWARLALEAYEKAGSPFGERGVTPPAPAKVPPPPNRGGEAAGAGAAAGGLALWLSSILNGEAGWASWLILVAAAAVLAAIGWLAFRHRHAIATTVRIWTSKL